LSSLINFVLKGVGVTLLSDISRYINPYVYGILPDVSLFCGIGILTASDDNIKSQLIYMNINEIE